MIKRAIFLLLLSCLLAACGNKGPLVLPDKPQAATAPAPIVPVPAPAAPAPAQAPPESAPQPDPVR
ncbi:lipoprotein [Thermomonas sp.]|uniref:LPS translocon maturation chaperone LptM n=1 Tax=Thermomonas sp. TaxID=1971895 RepID=UPI002C81CE84|nr:lipoprotein [Thermomonas sp.]HRO62716.1 lipoprotein [Thermomonas sp.]